MVKDIVPGSASSTPFNFVAVDGAVEFFAFDSSSDSSNGLFRSDGTATGTFELATNVGTSTPLPVTASPDGDFNGESFSDILWQNASGQASIWDMNQNTRTGGGVVSPNPGPNWKAIGTGDFNGDGFADILFQNTSGKPRCGTCTKTSGSAGARSPSIPDQAGELWADPARAPHSYDELQPERRIIASYRTLNRGPLVTSHPSSADPKPSQERPKAESASSR
jgi:hypothetical protein